MNFSLLLAANRAALLHAEPATQAGVPYDLPVWLAQHFDAAVLSIRSEAQLEEKFISPLLKQLGWVSVAQEAITVQGKLAKPDWCLVLESGQDDALVASKDHRLIRAICESKARGQNPGHRQGRPQTQPAPPAAGYLSTLRVRFGLDQWPHLAHVRQREV